MQDYQQSCCINKRNRLQMRLLTIYIAERARRRKKLQEIDSTNERSKCNWAK